MATQTSRCKHKTKRVISIPDKRNRLRCTDTCGRDLGPVVDRIGEYGKPYADVDELLAKIKDVLGEE